MTTGEKKDRPKASFNNIDRLYDAIENWGMTTSEINGESLDTMIRILARTNWKAQNNDIWDVWNAGGDKWSQMIKDVRKFSNDVTDYRKKLAKEEKKREKELKNQKSIDKVPDDVV
jgi:hypothetical protein